MEARIGKSHCTALEVFSMSSGILDAGSISLATWMDPAVPLVRSAADRQVASTTVGDPVGKLPSGCQLPTPRGRCSHGLHYRFSTSLLQDVYCL